jgi:hypothetical protein
MLTCNTFKLHSYPPLLDLSLAAGGLVLRAKTRKTTLCMRLGKTNKNQAPVGQCLGGIK